MEQHETKAKKKQTNNTNNKIINKTKKIQWYNPFPRQLCVLNF